MGTENTQLLTVNIGSSSLKLVLFNADSLVVVRNISVSNIGQTHTTLTVAEADFQEQSYEIEAANHFDAINAVFEKAPKKLPLDNMLAVGYRVVHGGSSFDSPVLINADVIEKLSAMSAFDPEHMPVILDLIRGFSHKLPNTPQVACFDTTFYRSMPKVAKLLPLPRKLESLGLRRYGFHGLSYESLLKSFREAAGETAANGRVIMAHLGGGASLTAIKNGQVLDTTMSFTPASGIPMSTRSGDLDPGIVDFLQRRTGMTSEEFNHMVHFESGLLGVSELSPDMYLLLQQSNSNPQAADAVALFCYQVRKTIGSLTTVMGGLDSLIFSGGIGENAPLVREEICKGLDYLGIILDKPRNQTKDFLISDNTSKVGVHVIKSDEAGIIAAQTKKIAAIGRPEPTGE